MAPLSVCHAVVGTRDRFPTPDPQHLLQAGGKTGPRVTRVGEWKLPLPRGSTQESFPGQFLDEVGNKRELILLTQVQMISPYKGV